MDIQRIKQVGIKAAYTAGEILIKHFGKLDTINKKGAIDLVTAADLESEKAIIATIQSEFPDHGILAEESGLRNGDTQSCWIIDPLDGTTNFAHSLNIFSISIAFSHQKEIIVGIVFNPISGELFTAAKDRGAELNNTPISVSSNDQLENCLLVTGFPYNLHSIIDKLMARFQGSLTATQGIRRLGSAALDLCYIACGRFDGFWEENLKPWDTAAGLLVAKEAGGKVTNFTGHRFNLDDKQILATNGLIHNAMINMLKIEDTNEPTSH